MSPAPKIAGQLLGGDVVPSMGTVLLVRRMGPLVLVKFTSGASKLYRRGQRVYL